jgi:hypothetical protein
MKGEEDKKRFSVVIFWLAKRMSAPGGLPKKVDADLQADYFNALSDFRIERLEWAAKHIFATQTWFPMPKDLREAAMLAPSTVLSTVTLNQKAIPEFTDQQHEDAAKKLDEIISGFGEWGKT